MVDLTLTDQCGNETVFEQDFQRAVVVPAGLCVDSTYALPLVNGDIPILDLTTDGMSLLGNDLLQDTLVIHATQVNGLWTLDSLTTGRWIGRARSRLWILVAGRRVRNGMCWNMLAPKDAPTTTPAISQAKQALKMVRARILGTAATMEMKRLWMERWTTIAIVSWPQTM